MIPAVHLLITSFCFLFLKSIILIAALLEIDKTFLLLYTYYVSLNDGIAEIEKPNGICSPTFVQD